MHASWNRSESKDVPNPDWSDSLKLTTRKTALPEIGSAHLKPTSDGVMFAVRELRPILKAAGQGMIYAASLALIAPQNPELSGFGSHAAET